MSHLQTRRWIPTRPLPVTADREAPWRTVAPGPFASAVALSVLLFVALVSPIRAGSPVSDRLSEVLDEIPSSAVESGILVDRVLSISGYEALDGRPDAPSVTLSQWRQMVDEFRRASFQPPAWPTLEELRSRSRAARAGTVIPVGILDLTYDRIRRDAVANGSLIPVGHHLIPSNREWLEARRLFAAAPLLDRTYQGSRVIFRLSRDLILENGATLDRRLNPGVPARFRVDFDDGNGFRTVDLDARVAVRYDTPGSKTVRLRMTRDDGSTAEASFLFQVETLLTPLPHDTLQVTATIPYGGAYGSGQAYIYLAPGHDEVTDPVVVVEGFDLDNSMGWYELYALLNRENLLEDLRALGFDAVVLDFTDATDYIQRHAFALVALLDQVRATIQPEKTIALAGASMGGVVSRYALAWMEDQGIDARVRTFISIDSPQLGADIPLGIQYWLAFFAGESTEAAELLAALDSPAARQLLVYHHTDPPGATGEPDPLRGILVNELAVLGNYPSAPRKVAVANGSGSRFDQGFAPGDQIIRWEYSDWLVDVIGNIWAVPSSSSHLIFHGLIDVILLPPEEQYVSVALTRPYDGAPGGWRDSMAEMDAVDAPYGDIIALHPNHCFIPTVSALALETDDLFYDIAGDPDLLALTPFDAVYFPVTNEEHVDINAGNAGILLEEIQYDASAVPPGPSEESTVARVAPPLPNPVPGSAVLRFVVPRAGRASLHAYDASGRRVAEIVAGIFDRGEVQVSWNGCGAAGERLPAGLYLLRLRGDGFAASGKVVLR